MEREEWIEKIRNASDDEIVDVLVDLLLQGGYKPEVKVNEQSTEIAVHV